MECHRALGECLELSIPTEAPNATQRVSEGTILPRLTHGQANSASTVGNCMNMSRGAFWTHRLWMNRHMGPRSLPLCTI